MARPIPLKTRCLDCGYAHNPFQTCAEAKRMARLLKKVRRIKPARSGVEKNK